jgi:predicted DNA-binding transcriptional regulator YafY
VQACSDRTRVRLDYRSENGNAWHPEVEPWAVVVRHGRWYLLCHSPEANAQRAYRVDRVGGVEVLEETFVPPADLDAVAELEAHLAVGWEYAVDVVVEASAHRAARWLPRELGRIEPIDGSSCRLVGSTSDPPWYASRLAGVPVPFQVVGGPELRAVVRAVGQRLLAATDGSMAIE